MSSNLVQPLPQTFYLRSTRTVAKELLGKILCRNLPKGEIWRGRIVETEAYLGIKDRACHTFGGKRSARTESMYLQGGFSYIYFIYGMHYCLNVVTRTEKHPEAVLIRALEPLNSPEAIQLKRKSTNGPGKLCRYLGIDRKLDGIALFRKDAGLWIENSPSLLKSQYASDKRVGIENSGEAKDWPLRFFIRDNNFVSRLP